MIFLSCQPLFPGESGVDQLVEIIKVILIPLEFMMNVVMFICIMGTSLNTFFFLFFFFDIVLSQRI